MGITDEPYILKVLGTRFDADLGAEKTIAANKGKEKILVEVKSFLSQSVTYEFHTAIGQFGHYLMGLELQEPDRVLFLAVPLPIYNEHFSRLFFQMSIQRNHLKILVFAPDSKTIVKWIN